MLRTLSKTLASSALALTIALTGIGATATPAAANGHRSNQGAEAAAIFGGLLLLYGLSQAGQANGRHHGAPVTVVPHQPHQPRVQPQQNHRVAPARCFIEGTSYGNYFRGYRAQCMQRTVSAPHLLPQHCLTDVWTNNGHRRIYGGRCLANAGWVREYAGGGHGHGGGRFNH